MLRSTFARCAAIVLVVAAVAPVSRAAIYPMGQTSTAGVFGPTGGTSAGISRGWDFQVNASGVQVTQLGVNAYQPLPLTLTLWDFATQTKLAQTTTTISRGNWVFSDLSTAVPLQQGHTYSVIGNAGTGLSSTWYLHADSAPAAFTPTGAIQMLNVRYDNGISADVFPTQTFALPYVVGVVDIGYVVPEPGTLSSLTAASLIATGRRRRRHA